MIGLELGAALNFSIKEILSLIPGLDRKAVFNAIDAFQLKGDYEFFLNEYIINDREFLSFRLERELDRALKEYHGSTNGLENLIAPNHYFIGWWDYLVKNQTLVGL